MAGVSNVKNRCQYKVVKGGVDLQVNKKKQNNMLIFAGLDFVHVYNSNCKLYFFGYILAISR